MKIGNKGMAICIGGTALAAALFWAVRFAEGGKPGLWTAAAFMILIFVSTALFTRSQR